MYTKFNIVDKWMLPRTKQLMLKTFSDICTYLWLSRVRSCCLREFPLATERPGCWAGLPHVLRTIMNIPMRWLQQLILIFQTIKQLSQCPFLTQAAHYNIIPDIHHPPYYQSTSPPKTTKYPFQINWNKIVQTKSLDNGDFHIFPSPLLLTFCRLN